MTTAIVFGSTTEIRPYGSAGAVLRLTWSARPERVEHCETQSEEALEKLPAHMRQAVICEGTTAAYRLEVRRDGTVVADQLVRGGGLRHDRALYVFRDIAVPVGDARIQVRFSRIDAAPAAGAAPAAVALPAGVAPLVDATRRQREDEERVREREEAVPASLVLDETVRFGPRQVALVTYDAERRALLMVQASQP